MPLTVAAALVAALCDFAVREAGTDWRGPRVYRRRAAVLHGHFDFADVSRLSTNRTPLDDALQSGPRACAPPTILAEAAMPSPCLPMI